jgi:hypothetical protein
VVLFVATWVGCQSVRPKSPTEKLRDATQTFYDGLRWKRYGQAAIWLPPAEREPFLKRRSAEAEDLFVLDYDVRRIEIAPDGQRAAVDVVYRWHKLPSTTIETTVIRQHWTYLGEDWQVDKQEQLENEKPAEGPATPPLL